MKMHFKKVDAAMTRKELKQLIIDGKTTAGPLAVLMYKNPVGFWTGAGILTIALTLIIIGLMSPM